MVWPVGFVRFGEGTLATYSPGKPQNSQISTEFEGSGAGIMKFLWKMKVLGVLAGRRRECLGPTTEPLPGSKIVENVCFGGSGLFPRPSRPMPPPGPLLPDPPGLVPGP